MTVRDSNGTTTYVSWKSIVIALVTVLGIMATTILTLGGITYGNVKDKLDSLDEKKADKELVIQFRDDIIRLRNELDYHRRVSEGSYYKNLNQSGELK